jgi:hypothetical protein
MKKTEEQRYQKEYRQRPQVKARKQQYQQKYMMEYQKRPAAEAARKAREQTKKRKAQRKTYNKQYTKRPDVRARWKGYYQHQKTQPKWKAMKKAYNQQPEVKAYTKAYRKQYNQKPEVKAKKKAYNKQYWRAKHPKLSNRGAKGKWLPNQRENKINATETQIQTSNTENNPKRKSQNAKPTRKRISSARTAKVRSSHDYVAPVKRGATPVKDRARREIYDDDARQAQLKHFPQTFVILAGARQRV